MDVGQLKGSVVINFGSVREAEKAIKALQGTFSSFTSESKEVVRATKEAGKANIAAAKASREYAVSEDRRQKALTQATAAEKQIMVLKRQSAAETTRGNIALNNARQALAIYRDGISRTDLSIDNLNKRYEILQRALTRASVSTTGLTSATANARSWFRSSRAAASQFGLQLQDVAVQAQMGTNALVILGQQGSQLLGFFGAGGAMAGAVLAIGAAFAYVMSSAGQAEQATKLLDESLSTLNDTIDETDDGVRVLSDEILRYAKVSETAARIELEKRLLDVGIAVREATTLIGSESSKFVSNFTTMAKKIDDFRNGALSGTDTVSGFSSEIVRFTSTLNSASKELGINRGQLESLMQAYNSVSDSPTEENFLSLIDTLSAIKMEAGDTTDNFTKLAGALNNAAVQAIEAIRNGEDIEQALKNLSKALDVSTEATNRSGKATKTAADEAAEYIARLKEESETLGMTRKQLVAYEIAKIAAKDSTIANKNALIEEAQAIVANMEARQKLADRLNALEGQGQGESEADKIKREWEMLKQLKGQYGDTTAAVQEYADKQQFLAEMYERTNNPEILRMMERYAEAFNNVSRGADNAAFSIMSFASNLDDIMNSQMESFTASAAGFAELFGANLSEGMQKGVVGLGAGIDSMMSLLETANRDSSTEYKRMAQMQATVAGALAITKIWGQYAAQPWIAAGLTALVAANTGAQIAAIQAANYATGGLVRGPGTGTSDDIPANLSNGEYVLRADAVRKIGVANLNAMNQGRMANFSSGGMVGSGSAGGNSSNTNVTVIDQRGSGAPVQTRETTDSYGNRSIELLIKDVVSNGMARGDFDSAMQVSYGIQRPGRRV
jgi:hypothetical protein